MCAVKSISKGSTVFSIDWKCRHYEEEKKNTKQDFSLNAQETTAELSERSLFSPDSLEIYYCSVFNFLDIHNWAGHDE